MAEQIKPTIPQQEPAAGADWPLPVQVAPEQKTPVYGSAEPAGGSAAALRRRAYALPEYDPRHWLLLLGADRIASTLSLLAEAREPGGQAVLLRHFQRQVAGQPKGALILGVATVAGAAFWQRRRRT